jgi:hypothetical protein
MFILSRLYSTCIYCSLFLFSIIPLFLDNYGIDINRDIYYLVYFTLFSFCIWYRYFSYKSFCICKNSLDSYNIGQVLHCRYIESTSLQNVCSNTGKLYFRVNGDNIYRELDLSVLGIDDNVIYYDVYNDLLGGYNGNITVGQLRNLIRSRLAVRRRKKVYTDNKFRYNSFKFISFVLYLLILILIYDFVLC